MATNPITQVHDALWTLLEANGNFTASVEASNRIEFTGGVRNPRKDTHASSDFPEVRIVPLSTETHLQRTSNGSSLVKTFAIQVLVGDQQADTIYDLEWEIYRALEPWQATLGVLTWNSKKYVKLCRPLTVSTELGVDKQVGWIGVVRLAATKTITIDLLGTDTGATDLTISIEYIACVDGGYLV